MTYVPRWRARKMFTPAAKAEPPAQGPIEQDPRYIATVEERTRLLAHFENLKTAVEHHVCKPTVSNPVTLGSGQKLRFLTDRPVLLKHVPQPTGDLFEIFRPSPLDPKCFNDGLSSHPSAQSGQPEHVQTSWEITSYNPKSKLFTVNRATTLRTTDERKHVGRKPINAPGTNHDEEKKLMTTTQLVVDFTKTAALLLGPERGRSLLEHVAQMVNLSRQVPDSGSAAAPKAPGVSD